MCFVTGSLTTCITLTTVYQWTREVCSWSSRYLYGLRSRSHHNGGHHRCGRRSLLRSHWRQWWWWASVGTSGHLRSSLSSSLWLCSFHFFAEVYLLLPMGFTEVVREEGQPTVHSHHNYWRKTAQTKCRISWQVETWAALAEEYARKSVNAASYSRRKADTMRSVCVCSEQWSLCKVGRQQEQHNSSTTAAQQQRHSLFYLLLTCPAAARLTAHLPHRLALQASQCESVMHSLTAVSQTTATPTAAIAAGELSYCVNVMVTFGAGAIQYWPFRLLRLLLHFLVVSHINTPQSMHYLKLRTYWMAVNVTVDSHCPSLTHSLTIGYTDYCPLAALWYSVLISTTLFHR